MEADRNIWRFQFCSVTTQSVWPAQRIGSNSAKSMSPISRVEFCKTGRLSGRSDTTAPSAAGERRGRGRGVDSGPHGRAGLHCRVEWSADPHRNPGRREEMGDTWKRERERERGGGREGEEEGDERGSPSLSTNERRTRVEEDQ